MDQNPIIEFRRMTFGFLKQVPIFSNLSLSLEKGAFYGIQGPSGSGKTTFLRLINRLEEPLSGEIRFKKTPVTAYPPPELRRSLLYIQQTPTVMDESVEKNLLLPFSFKINRHLTPPHRETTRELMDELNLQNIRMQDHAMTLSVGQMQRLCLVRGLLLNPEVLLLDEPLSALDRENTLAVMTLLERFNQKFGLTLLMISHKTDAAAPMIHRHLEVSDGNVREIP